MPRKERKKLIEDLEAQRGASTRVISYITSTRSNLEVQMAMDVIPLFYKHLIDLGANADETRIDLFIHSNGGEGTVPWRLVTLLREYCEHFAVLVPHRAFSAATLVALGADEVVMHPMGMLGPTDPTVANDFNPQNPLNPQQLVGISVEDVQSYIALVKEEVGIHHEDELVEAFLALTEKVHPLALGNVNRSIMQARMMGEKLLGSRQTDDPLGDHEVQEIIRKLTSELFYHGHPINRSEARDDVGLEFVEDATPAVADAMWALYRAYDSDMRLNEPFDPTIEAIGMNPLPLPGVGQPPNVGSARLDTVKAAYVESSARCDVFELDVEATLMRQFNGAYEVTPGFLRREWGTEEPEGDG